MRQEINHPNKMNRALPFLAILAAVCIALLLFRKQSSISGFENANPSNKYTGPQSMSGANTTDTADQARLAANGMTGAPTGANAGASLTTNQPSFPPLK
jgi:hypothetical protein